MSKGRVKLINSLVKSRNCSLPFSYLIAEEKDICPPSGSDEVIINYYGLNVDVWPANTAGPPCSRPEGRLRREERWLYLQAS